MTRAPAFVLLAAIAATWACDEKPSEAGPAPAWKDSPSPTPTGPTFEDEDFVLTVQSPEICNKQGPMAPEPGHERLSLPVEVESRTGREVPVGAMSFTLEDEQGHEYRPTLAGCSPSIAQTALAGGQSVAGHVAFDVPQDVGRLEIRFEPFLIGRKKVTARAQVPR